MTSSSIRNRLLAGVAALFALRLVLSLIRTGPVLVADELGYLGNARVLAGDLAAQLQLAPFYRGGYSLLIAPLLALTSDPELAYRLTLILNALLAAAVFPLLYLLLNRFAGVEARTALWVALAGAAYPAVTVLSQVAMSENVLYPLVCAWLLCFAGLLAAEGGRRAQLPWALGLGACTGALWSVHNRMGMAVAIALVALAWMGARRRIDRGAAVAGIAVIALALLGTHFLDDFLMRENYGPGAEAEASNRLGEITTGHGLLTAMANLAGQSWYLLVATFGLVAVAASDFLARRREPADAGRQVLGVLLLLTLLLVAISAAAFPERTRPDMLIYGRYTEIVAPALIAFGLLALPRWRQSLRPLPWALGFGAFTALVVLIRISADDPGGANRWNIAALPFVTSALGPAILLGAALVAAAGAVLLVRLSKRPPLAFAVAIGLFLAVTAYGAWNPVRSSQRAVYPDGWSSPETVAAGNDIDRVEYDMRAYDTIGLYVTQWYLPETEVGLFGRGRVPAGARYVISSEDWRREQREPGARALWSDTGRDQVIWKLAAAGGRSR